MPKHLHCVDYIRDYVQNNCEASVIEEGVKILPFRSLQAFYDDYVISWFLRLGEDCHGKVAAIRTFGRAFSLNFPPNTIRFLRNKGSFNHCEVCNTAADLLTTRRFSKVIRHLIGFYRG
jgi:hypothetical protein